MKALLAFSFQGCYTEVNSLWPAIIVYNFYFSFMESLFSSMF